MNHKPFLPTIHSPADVKALEEKDLPLLAEEVRAELIRVLSQTGGHLGPNLGVVELTIALHRVFNTPRDKFVFDVSHQGYVHKLFTGRRERFSSIRQYQGLNGFLLRTESEHDCYGAGHAGTALSAALGMAAARDMLGGDEHVVCVAGDAAFTCGVSFEALNNLAATTRRLILVLNDNEWSIAKNVGAVAEYLNRIVANPAFAHLHDKAGQFVEWLAGKQARHLAHKVEAGVKNLLAPSVIFEDLGLRYYGPIDGHDIPLLIRTFEFLKTQNEPVILHILTKKGKGYAPALEKPDKFHGLGKFHLDTGETVASAKPTYSELLGKTLADFADHNNKIVGITAAMPSGTGLVHFSKRHPNRFFDVGISRRGGTYHEHDGVSHSREEVRVGNRTNRRCIEDDPVESRRGLFNDVLHARRRQSPHRVRVRSAARQEGEHLRQLQYRQLALGRRLQTIAQPDLR